MRSLLSKDSLSEVAGLARSSSYQIGNRIVSSTGSASASSGQFIAAKHVVGRHVSGGQRLLLEERLRDRRYNDLSLVDRLRDRKVYSETREREGLAWRKRPLFDQKVYDLQDRVA